MPKVVSIHQPEHLPWLGFFHKMASCDLYVILDSVQFEKNYFQNRNRIRDVNSSEGWMWVTVPVRTGGRSDQLISEVMINNADTSWRGKSFKTIQQSYARAPYVQALQPFLEETYRERTWNRLLDLNLHLIDYFRGALQIDTPTVRSSELRVTTARTQLLLDICRATGASTYLSGPSGRSYLELDRFAESGIDVRFHEFIHPVYEQGSPGFVPRLSVLDLIVCCGPDSRRILLGPPTQSS